MPTAEQPCPPTTTLSQSVREILAYCGSTEHDLRNDFGGHFRYRLVAQLCNDGLFTDQRQAERFADLLRSAVNGTALSDAMAQWIIDTQGITAKLAELKEQRERSMRWHNRLAQLGRELAAAEKTLATERWRMEGATRTEDDLARDYIQHVAGNDHVPAGTACLFVENFRVDCELAKLLRERVVPELEKRVAAAKRALDEFSSTAPAA